MVAVDTRHRGDELFARVKPAGVHRRGYHRNDNWARSSLTVIRSKCLSGGLGAAKRDLNTPFGGEGGPAFLASGEPEIAVRNTLDGL